MRYAVTALVVLLFGFSSLGFSEQSENSTIRLGVVAPFSGDYAYQGEFIRNGVELAVGRLRAEGKDVKVYYEDACLPKAALTAARKLLSKDIHAVVGSYCVIGMVPMASIFEQNKILAFHSSAVSDTILNAGEYVMTTNIAIEDEARELAAMAREELTVKRAGIIYFPSDWGDDYSTYFADEFTERGGEVVFKDIAQLSQMDFRTQLTRMKAKGVDVIFVAHISSALGIIVKQAKTLGMDVQFLSTDEAEDPQFFEAAGKFAEGMRILTPEPEELTSIVKDFRLRYGKNFRSDPPVTAANAYDATQIAVKVIEQCNFDAECMKEAAYQITDYSGVSGNFSIEPDGRTKKGFVQKIAKGRRFTRLQ